MSKSNHERTRKLRALCKWIGIFSVAFGGVCAASPARAEQYVYVHGWTASGADLTSCTSRDTCPRYWKEQLSGVPVHHVGWNTAANWSESGVSNMVSVLDSSCSRSRASDACTIICHSTGCPIAGAALDWYGEGGARWRVTRVLTLGSAEGGTELASTGAGLNAYARLLQDSFLNGLGEAFGFDGDVVNPSARYLTPGYVRDRYDHNDTAGVPFFHVAGYDGGSYGAALILPGQDDGVVPFHSACGYVKAFSSTQCSNDWEWATKKVWGVTVPVMRNVAQWQMHQRVEYCGRDGCDKRHDQLLYLQFQALAPVPNP
jgi:hypothetical protein